MRNVVKVLFFAGLIVFGVAWYNGDALPSSDELLPSLANEPVQMPISMAPFDTTIGGVVYRIRPLYRYELWGLVVSVHQSDQWWDYIHREWNDKINVMDVCVVWGNAALSGIYEKMTFSSGQFVCYYNYSAATATILPQDWESHGLSNNHLLVDQEMLRRQLKKVRVGDQIHFSGYLAEYSHSGGFHRGTSTVRTDRGNGACETVFVESFEHLRHPRHWLMLRWSGAIAMLMALALYFLLPDRYFGVAGG
jgi:hypothetical protein